MFLRINTYSINQKHTDMKTLTQYLNETLENTLQLEIAKIVDRESEEKQEEQTIED